MRTKQLIAPILIAGFAFSLLVMPSLAAPQAQEKQEKKDVKQPAAKVFIPKDVRDILLKNLPTRQIREDIPFTIFRSSFLPAQSAFYVFFYLKMKNADLGYAAAAPQAAAAAISAAAPATVKATFDVFLQFHKMENGQPTQILKEVYVPTTQEQDAAGYDPTKEDWYTVGYPLPAGQYLVAMAVTTHDLKKIGTQYYEFSLPDVKALKELDTTPVFFLKDYKELPAAEQVAALHRNFLRYSILQISPNIENVVSPGDPLDLFFVILGAQANETILLNNWNWKVDNGYIEVNGEVKNIKNENLKNVEAVASFYDKDGKFITSSSALIEYNPITPNQTSPFKILEKVNPEIKNVTVELKIMGGEKISGKQYSIECQYEVRQGDKAAVKFATANYDNPFISQPLPLKQTLITKDKDGKESQSIKDLGAGSYTFTVKLTDKISGRTGAKSVDFTVK